MAKYIYLGNKKIKVNHESRNKGDIVELDCLCGFNEKDFQKIVEKKITPRITHIEEKKIEPIKVKIIEEQKIEPVMIKIDKTEMPEKEIVKQTKMEE